MRAFGRGPLTTPLTANQLQTLTPGALKATHPDLEIDLVGGTSGRREVLRLRPTFDASADEQALFGALLAGRAPLMEVLHGQGSTPMARSCPRIEDDEVLARALGSVFSRLVSLVVRSVERTQTGAEPEGWSEPPPANEAKTWGTPDIVRFAAREFAIKLKRQFTKRSQREGHWLLASRPTPRETSNGLQPAVDGFTALELSSDAYYADPFIHERDGQAVLFAEKFPYNTGTGVLVCAELQPDGGWSPFETCLERPYHLSYPFVFDHAGETWLMAETGQNGTLELYRAVQYPTDWVLDRVLMQDVALADATLVEWEGRWWLFAARSSLGGSIQDELVGFHAPSPLGPWTPHALDPLKSDARSARPAGRFVKRDGRLLRPAQDCETGYGTGLVWCEVTALTPTHFQERVVGRWRGADFDADGVHTFATGGGVDVIDLKRTVRR